MANILRSNFTPTEPIPAWNAPKTAEMRKAEREEKKAAKRRAAAAFQQARNHALTGLSALRQRVKERATHPGYCDRVARGLTRRWYGLSAERIPLVMIDYRYWQALSCGWQPLEGRDENGAPMGPLAEWYGTWWCRLHYQTREMFVRMSRSNGKGIWRQR
jgi:hypothetical protein